MAIFSPCKITDPGNKFTVNRGCNLLSLHSFAIAEACAFFPITPLLCKAAYLYRSNESSIGTAPVGSISSAKTWLSGKHSQ